MAVHPIEVNEHQSRKPVVLRGRVQSGAGNAAHWLALFNDAYARKTAMPVFPGSLNLGLDEPFDWFDPRWQHAIAWFGREEYGGERDILLLPCVLIRAPAVPAFLWSTTVAAKDPTERLVVELIAPVSLRTTLGLADGDIVEIELLLQPRSEHAG